MKTYIIEIDESTLAIIGEGLVELPYRKSAPVIGDINRQIAEQSKPEKKNDDSPGGDK